MEIIEINSWGEWKQETERLIAENRQANEQECYTPPLLFRGQKSASWGLESSLERLGNKLPSMELFHKEIMIVKIAFESLTGKRWNQPFDSKLGDDYPGPPKDYEFLVYLRHNGYPTPILDWTRSPYVASFFAYQQKSSEKQVAIFIYQESKNGCKGGWVGEPTIINCGPTIRTHERHYIQQAEYTYCKKKEGDNWYYANHEDGFSCSDEDQDILKKYILPANERRKAMADLDAMNINAFSLFGSEEGLAEMLSNRNLWSN